MLPPSITTIYQQYKHDTDLVASWLVETARDTGYKGDLNPPSDRLKGKARKQAKKGETPPKPQQLSKKFVLPIRNFVPLAEHALKTSGIQVPTYFVIAIDRAIRIREGFGTRINDHGNQVQSGDPNSCQFFVDVLIEVKDVLKSKLPELPKEQQQQQHRHHHHQHHHHHHNHHRHDHHQPLSSENGTNEGAKEQENGDTGSGVEKKMGDLTLKVDADSEFDDSFLSTPDIDFTDRVEDPSCEAEISDSMDDVLFVFSALVQDSRVLRGRIQSLWTSYLNGTLGLAPVAVATDTSIALVRQMEADLAPMLQKHNRNVGQLISAYYIGICQSSGYDPVKKEDSNDDMNFDCYDIGDSTMHNVYTLLRAFRDVLSPKGYPAYHPGYCGIYDPSTKLKEKTNRQKWVEDKVLLMESLPDLLLLGREIVGPHKEKDEFTRLVSHMYSTREISFALAFAAQVFLDVQRVMRAKSARPFVEMMVFGKFVSDSIHKALEAQTSLNAEKSVKERVWSAQNDQKLLTIARDGTIWSMDPINRFKKSTGLASSEVPAEANVLLKRHPLFCGLWLHAQRMSFHTAGIAYSNAWQNVLYTGHLYATVLRERMLRVPPKEDSGKPRQKHWKDMDCAIACQEDSFLGGGTYAKTRFKYLENFCNAIGLSINDFTENPRSAFLRNRSNRKAKRGLREAGKVSSRLRAGRGMPLNVDAIQAIIASSDWQGSKATSAADNGIKKTGGINYNNRENQNQKADDTKNVHVSLSAFLWQEALALQVESVELSFDYFALHRTCHGILGQLRGEVEMDLTRSLPGSTNDVILDDESQLAFLVGYIFVLLASD